MILPYDANPGRVEFSEKTGSTSTPVPSPTGRLTCAVLDDSNFRFLSTD